MKKDYLFKVCNLWLVGICLLLMGMNFTACSDDDDETGTGSATLTIDGNKTTLNHAYWYCTPGNSENKYSLELMTFDMYNIKNESQMPSNYSIILIDFNAEGSVNEIPTGTFPANKYHVYTVLGNMEHQYEQNEHKNSSNSALIITKENGGYKVNIEKVYIGDDGPEDKEMSFSYNGTFKTVPEWGLPE